MFGGGFWAQGASNRWGLSIVELDAAPLLVLVSYFDGTPAADVAAAQAIVESFEFTP